MKKSWRKSREETKTRVYGKRGNSTRKWLGRGERGRYGGESIESKGMGV